jgi:Zn-finger nucleic acid-binding protein
MNCPSCGAPLRIAGGLNNLRCDYCKSVYYSGPDEEGIRYIEETEKALCPACDAPLWNASLWNVPVRACKKCKGMLVPMGAFEGLIEQERGAHPGTEVPVASDGSDLGRKLKCPLCHRAMETHFYYGGGHVVIEDCEWCEMNWLDGGGLRRIARAPHANAEPEF